jgi:hypothetical protein
LKIPLFSSQNLPQNWVQKRDSSPGAPARTRHQPTPPHSTLPHPTPTRTGANHGEYIVAQVCPDLTFHRLSCSNCLVMLRCSPALFFQQMRGTGLVLWLFLALSLADDACDVFGQLDRLQSPPVAACSDPAHKLLVAQLSMNEGLGSLMVTVASGLAHGLYSNRTLLLEPSPTIYILPPALRHDCSPHGAWSNLLA